MTEIVADKKIDIRGLVCPHTFVRSKLAVEVMDVGQVLEIALNHKPATNSIPNAMKELGHEVLELAETEPGEWRILIRKGKKD